MYELIDDFRWEENNIIVTCDVHRIDGLKNLSYWNIPRANPLTPLHHHSDIVEIHCLTKGKLYRRVDDTIYAIKGSEVFITFPYEQHSSKDLPQYPCSYYAFQIDLKNRDELLGLSGEYSRALSEGLLGLKAHHLKYEPAHIDLMRRAFSLISADNAVNKRLGVQYLCCFLFELLNLQPVSDAQDYPVDKYIQKTIDYIEENFKEPLPLKDLAAIAGYSLSRFKMKFKEEVGVTPGEYVSLRKIEYAKHQLQTTDIPISDIAFEVGFSSSNYFSSVFSKLSSYTPSDYRRLSRESVSEKQQP